MRYKSSYILMLMSMLIIQTSCQPHDTFCFNHPHAIVILQYDWSQAHDAHDVKGTRVYFFDGNDGNKYTRMSFNNMEGGTLYLTEGRYNAIAFNNDTDKLFWKGDNSQYTLETYTRNAELTEELPGFDYEHIEGLVLTPNRLYVANKEDIKVERNDTTYIILTPQKATYELIWDVTGILGANRVDACAVSVSGIGGSLLPYDMRTERNESLMSGIGTYVPGDGEEDEDGDEIGGFEGRFEIFGCNFLDECEHSLTIYCWSSGGNIRVSYDVTDQMHIVKEDRKIYIHIDADFEIPDDGNDVGGGFDPDVGNWNEINEDIIL